MFSVLFPWELGESGSVCSGTSGNKAGMVLSVRSRIVKGGGVFLLVFMVGMTALGYLL